MRTARFVTLALANAGLVCVRIGIASEFGFAGLGAFGSPPWSHALDVSADGGIAIGSVNTDLGGRQACYWTAPGDVVQIGEGWGAAVSHDGKTIVGQRWNTDENTGEAFMWTEGSGMIGLGDLPGGNFQSDGFGISGDAQYVIGFSVSGNGPEAFRWSANEGMTGLGDLPGGEFASYAYDASADGTKIVGTGTGENGPEAFLWSADDGFRGLGRLDGADFSVGNGMSSDGAFVVGFSGPRAFRWSESSGMLALEDLPRDKVEAIAYDVSDDGAIVVGSSLVPDEIQEAVGWDLDGGIFTLKSLLLDHGVAEVEAWQLYAATAVSADGRTIVGQGLNPSGLQEAWIATIPEPRTAVLLAVGLMLIVVNRRR
jgi:probable HAF family extracellular repeat protein